MELCRKIACIASSIEHNISSRPRVRITEGEDNRCNIRWKPPDYNFVKLNCDGAITHWGVEAAAGGVTEPSWRADLGLLLALRGGLYN